MQYAHPVADLPYRKDIFREAMEYESLTISQMHDKDRKFVLKCIIKLNSQKDAEDFCFKMTQNGILNWSYSKLDLHGRIGILKYKGIEVALFIKRQTTKRRIDPEHPVSEAKMKDPKDAWMRFDLFGLSAKQSRRPTVETIAKLERELEKTQQKLATQIAISEQLDAEVKRAKKNANKKRPRKAKILREYDKAAKRKASRNSKIIKQSRKHWR